MTRFDQAFKDEVRARNDIVEVVSSYVKLERRGNRYIGLCPFHGEKTPSFHVIPDMQIYHCFGCKASGDVFKFIQEREHLTFYEALVHLAKRVRLSLPQEERTPEEEKAYREKRAVYDVLDLGTRFFQYHLMNESGKAGLDYLLERGITQESIRRFQLGWAPGRGLLYKALSSRFSADVLQNAGLILPRRDGPGYMDAFFERVMFPIMDLSGRVIGFGGRILQGNAPKYKNSAETSLFSKRRVLFGLTQAKEAIRAKNQAILVEGYFDVIMPHQASICHVVAPLGTALTDEQCMLLRRQAEQVIVAFDADTAGQMATLRGLDKLYETGCDVRILRLPDGKDPDEYIRAYGSEAFQRCIAEAIPLIEFKLRLAMSRNAGNAPETKARAVEEVARVLADLKNDVLREEYVHRVANELATTPVDIPELKRAIDRQMNRVLRQGFQHNQPNSRNNIKVPGFDQPAARRDERSSNSPLTPPAVHVKYATPADLVWKAERTLLFLALQRPGLFVRIRAMLGDQPFGDPIHDTILKAAQAALGKDGLHEGPIVARVLDTLSDPNARLIFTEMAAKPMVSAYPEEEAEDCIEKIREHRVSRRLEELENQMKSQGKAVDQAIAREYVALQQQRKKRSHKS